MAGVVTHHPLWFWSLRDSLCVMVQVTQRPVLAPVVYNKNKVSWQELFSQFPRHRQLWQKVPLGLCVYRNGSKCCFYCTSVNFHSIVGWLWFWPPLNQASLKATVCIGSMPRKSISTCSTMSLWCSMLLVMISQFLSSEEKSLMADTWVGNGFVPFEEIIQSQVHGLKRTPTFPCILLESWLNSSTELILVLLCREEIVSCTCHLPEVSSYF